MGDEYGGRDEDSGGETSTQRRSSRALLCTFHISIGDVGAGFETAPTHPCRHNPPGKGPAVPYTWAMLTDTIAPRRGTGALLAFLPTPDLTVIAAAAVALANTDGGADRDRPDKQGVYAARSTGAEVARALRAR